MPKYVPKRLEQILSQMIARVVARTDLSDVSDTSVVKHILKAAARADDELYYQTSLLLQLFSIDLAVGDDLDQRAKDVQPTVISRNQALRSTGPLVFSRNGTSGTVTIPAGTSVKTASGVSVTTTALTTITPTSAQQIPGHGVGRDSAPVAALADNGGAAGNVATGTLVKFASKPAGVDEVTNLSPFLGGQDTESDDSFRARIKAFIAGLARCSVNAIEANVTGLVDPVSGKTAKYVKVIEDLVSRGYITVYVDDGTGTAEANASVSGEVVTLGLAGPPPDSAVGGEVYLNLANWPVKVTTAVITSSIRGVLVEGTDFTLNYASGQLYFITPLVASEVITASYTYYTGLLQFVQKVVDGDPHDRTNYPGLRAAGVLAQVLTPAIVVQAVEATVTVVDGYDEVQTRANVANAVQTYINSLGISGDVVRNELIRVIMEVSGIYNLTLNVPSADVIILDDQLARTTAASISIT